MGTKVGVFVSVVVFVPVCCCVCSKKECVV